jgi:NADH:ubiquinone oxidoreductase subunit 4 (subunit M)
LLWAYQRVALGEVTLEKNRTLPDASTRERVILATVALAIVFMGLASPLFTRRMEASTYALLDQMNRPALAAKPQASAPPTPATAVTLPSQQAKLMLATSSTRQVRP